MDNKRRYQIYPLLGGFAYKSVGVTSDKACRRRVIFNAVQKEGDKKLVVHYNKQSVQGVK